MSYNSFALHPEMYNNKLQIISPSRKYQLVAAFTTQLLQYQAVPREGVYVGAFVYERTLHRVYCKRNQCSAITLLERVDDVFGSLLPQSQACICSMFKISIRMFLSPLFKVVSTGSKNDLESIP